MIKKYSKGVAFIVLSFFIFMSGIYGQSELVKTIYFKSSSSLIDKKYYKMLDQVAKQLVSDTYSFLKVFGYADKKGSETYNDMISEKRVNAVYNLSAHANIDTTAVYTTWLGESDEAYDLHFPKAHIRQRCVDVWVMFYRKPKAKTSK